MNPGDNVTVPVKTFNGRRTVTTQKPGVVIAVRDSQELYPDPPEYSPAYDKLSPHKRKTSKFPAGDKIIQVQVDGRAVNYHQSEVASA